MRGFLCGLASALFAVFVQPSVAATVNITTTSSRESASVISVVDILGLGTGADAAFPDYLMAPGLGDTGSALDAAALNLGLPPGTLFEDLVLVEVGTFIDLIVTVVSNYNPVDDPLFVIGDADDYFTWIATGDEDVNVEVFMVERTVTQYRLSAQVTPPVSAVPLPAGALLLLTGIAALPLMRRRARV